MPDNDCNPACQKYYANGRLMGVTGKRLLGKCAFGGALHKAVKALIEAAEYASEVVRILTESGALVRSGEFAWTGCEQATEIAKWASGSTADVPSDAAAKMQSWANDLYTHADALIRGN